MNEKAAEEIVSSAATSGVRMVSFHRMEDGTREDYELLEESERDYIHALPDQILAALRKLDNGLQGYPVSRLGHSLQTATRALKDGADDELIVAALIHDVGDDLAPYNHSEIAAGIIRTSQRPRSKCPRQISRPPLVPSLQGFLRQLGPMLLRSRLSLRAAEHLRTPPAPDLQPARARPALRGQGVLVPR